VLRSQRLCRTQFWNWAQNVSNDVVPSNFGGFRIHFGLVTAVVFVSCSSPEAVVDSGLVRWLRRLFSRFVRRSRRTESTLYLLVLLRLRLAEDLGSLGLLLSRVLRSSSVFSSSEDDEAKVKCFLGFFDKSRLAERHLLQDPAHRKPLRRPERRIDESRCWKSSSLSLDLRTSSSLWPRSLEPSERRPRRSVKALWCDWWGKEVVFGIPRWGGSNYFGRCLR